jgi:hypothetical protein
MEAARQQYESAKNGAAQQYQALQAARARSRSRQRPSPTPSFARRLPAWSPSASPRRRLRHQRLKVAWSCA